MKDNNHKAERTLKDIVDDNRENRLKEADKFMEVFGVPILKYMHPLFGFDVISFDKFMKTPDGTSTAQYVREKYGLDGLNIILRLMNLPEEEQ